MVNGQLENIVKLVVSSYFSFSNRFKVIICSYKDKPKNSRFARFNVTHSKQNRQVIVGECNSFIRQISD